MDWLRERYPELSAEAEPRRSMAQFDMLVCIRCGHIEHRAAAFFELARDAAAEFALRLHENPHLRERIAAALGMTLADFDDAAPAHLREAQGFPGGFMDHGAAANLLEHGRARV